jgi:hypothetical protein
MAYRLQIADTYRRRLLALDDGEGRLERRLMAGLYPVLQGAPHEGQISVPTNIRIAEVTIASPLARFRVY